MINENQKQIRIVVFILVFTTSLVAMSSAYVRSKVEITLSPIESLLTLPSVQEEANKELLAENETLINRITALDQEARLTDEDKVLAEVVGFGDDPYDRSVIINQGAKKGVENGQPVLAQNNFIGIVSRVEERRAVVKLINDPQFKTVVRTEKGIEGLLLGQFGSLTMERIPRDSTISVGDSVFTLGEVDGVKAGLYVGRVRELVQEDGLLQTAFIEPNVSLDSLRAVSVLKGL